MFNRHILDLIQVMECRTYSEEVSQRDFLEGNHNRVDWEASHSKDRMVDIPLCNRRIPTEEFKLTSQITKVSMECLLNKDTRLWLLIWTPSFISSHKCKCRIIKTNNPSLIHNTSRLRTNFNSQHLCLCSPKGSRWVRTNLGPRWTHQFSQFSRSSSKAFNRLRDCSTHFSNKQHLDSPRPLWTLSTLNKTQLNSARTTRTTSSFLDSTSPTPII